MNATFHAAVLSALAAITPLAVLAADPIEPNEGPWRAVLKDQLKSEKACDLNEVLAYQEVPLGDDLGVDGRVSCFDGRLFDFTRKGRHRKFSIELCTPAVC